MGIRFSVVFPLAEERGMTSTALSAWTGQTLPADRFEVLVAADLRTEVDPELHSLLRADDRVIRAKFANLSHQFDAAVCAGSGEFLFLTESHCIPAPDCLEAMDRWLGSNPHLAGACCESIPAWNNAYQWIDATTFEEGYRHFIRTNDWRKLSVHGMALRRDVYLGVGGLQYRYGRFAEMLLAAALRDAGHELGHVRDSRVTHHYRESLQEIIDGTDEYVASECLYRAANPGPDRVGHTYFTESTNPFSTGTSALERDVIATLLSGAVGRDTGAMREALAGVGRIVARSIGRRGPVFAAWLAVALGRVRCWWNRHDAQRVDRPYRELVRLASVLSRARFLASQPVDDPPLPEPASRFEIAALPEWSLYGFHGLEHFKGARFRWSKRVAGLRLPLPRGAYRLRLTTGGIPRSRVNLRAAFNGSRIDPVVRGKGDHELRIEPYHCHLREQTLVLVAEPLCPWRQGVKDYRELGLPVFAVEAIPATFSADLSGRVAA
jgi:hypothetical protein